MELVITVLTLTQTVQGVYMYFIAKKQDEMIDIHNNFVEALATAVDDIEQHTEETQ